MLARGLLLQARLILPSLHDPNRVLSPQFQGTMNDKFGIDSTRIQSFDQLSMYSMIEESSLDLLVYRTGMSQTPTTHEYIKQFASKLWLDDAGNLVPNVSHCDMACIRRLEESGTPPLARESLQGLSVHAIPRSLRILVFRSSVPSRSDMGMIHLPSGYCSFGAVPNVPR